MKNIITTNRPTEVTSNSDEKSGENIVTLKTIVKTKDKTNIHPKSQRTAPLLWRPVEYQRKMAFAMSPAMAGRSNGKIMGWYEEDMSLISTQKIQKAMKGLYDDRKRSMANMSSGMAVGLLLLVPSCSRSRSRFSEFPEQGSRLDVSAPLLRIGHFAREKVGKNHVVGITEVTLPTVNAKSNHLKCEQDTNESQRVDQNRGINKYEHGHGVRYGNNVLGIQSK